MWKILKKSKDFKDMIIFDVIMLMITAGIVAHHHSTMSELIGSTIFVILTFLFNGALLYEVEKICQKGEEEEESQQ